ncbi:MAG: mannose-1-phosphate guanylyltransferase [Legionellales bacterium]|nr:mannose-1-phosphate guanylyltransferase [Legionellales bacterium]
MKAMLLAAGHGKRMGELTQSTPKPLLEIRGESLLGHHLRALAAHGISDVVINVSHLKDQIIAAIGDGSQWGINVVFSQEDQPLETGGGIANALPLLGDEPFIAINSDIWTDYPFSQLPSTIASEAHLVMVDNPEHVPNGDFAIDNDKLSLTGSPKYTYSGIAVYRPAFFAGIRATRFPLGPLFKHKIADGLLSGEYYDGEWFDVGTPERLAAVQQS